MMLKFLTLSAGLLVALAPSAHAQPIPSNPNAAAPPAATSSTPPDAEQLAKAKARADALLTKGEAVEQFVNITDGMLPKVRHKLSGLICVFQIDSEYSKIESLPRNGAACTEKEQGVVSKVWLTPSLSLPPQEISKLQISTKKYLHPDAQPYTGRTLTMEMAGLPRSYDAYSTYSDKTGRITGAVGNPVVCRDSVAQVRGWDIKMTAYTHNKDADSGVYLATLSGFSWLAALQSVAQKPAI